MMQYLIDSANVDAIRHLITNYPVDGVTTNPTILSREKRAFLPLITEIRDEAASGAAFDHFYQWVKEHEPELAPVLDVFELLDTYRRRQNRLEIVPDLPVTE